MATSADVIFTAVTPPLGDRSHAVIYTKMTPQTNKALPEPAAGARYPVAVAPRPEPPRSEPVAGARGRGQDTFFESIHTHTHMYINRHTQ